MGGVGLVVVGGGEAAVDVLPDFALGGDLLFGQDGLLGVLGGDGEDDEAHSCVVKEHRGDSFF